VATVHHGERSHKCELCLKTFGRKRTLNKHVAVVHHGEKQFKCEICFKQIADKANFNKHMSSVLQCQKSRLNVKFVGKLTTHVAPVHLSEWLFKCEVPSIRHR
jgi:uncharacterized Zn-finger protein